MICKKCERELGNDIMVLKVGEYRDKPLCKKCFYEEKEKFYGGSSDENRQII